MVKTMTSLYIESEVLDEVEKIIGKLGLTKHSFMVRAITAALEDGKAKDIILADLDVLSENKRLKLELKEINKLTSKFQIEANGSGGVKPVSVLGKSDEQIIMLEKKTLQSFDRIRLVDVRDQFVGTRTDLLNEKLDEPVSREEYLGWVEECLK